MEDEIIKLHKNYCEKTLFDSNPKWLEPIECVVLGGEGGKTNGFRQYPLNGFINKLLTDDEFYQKWGNDCCETMTDEERLDWMRNNKTKTILPMRDPNVEFTMDEFFRPYGVPKRKLKEDEKI